MFLHIREPSEIEKAARDFNAKTILLIRDSVKHIESNVADRNVFDYKYDMFVINNGTLKDLCTYAKEFVLNELEA